MNKLVNFKEFLKEYATTEVGDSVRTNPDNQIDLGSLKIYVEEINESTGLTYKSSSGSSGTLQSWKEVRDTIQKLAAGEKIRLDNASVAIQINKHHTHYVWSIKDLRDNRNESSFGSFVDLIADLRETKHDLTEARKRSKVSEDAPANSSGSGIIAGLDSNPPMRRKEQYQEFEVDPETFNRCKKGKRKWARWQNYFNLESKVGKRIYEYAVKKRKKPIVLKNSKDGSKLFMRYNRHGGGGAVMRRRDIPNEISTQNVVQ